MSPEYNVVVPDKSVEAFKSAIAGIPGVEIARKKPIELKLFGSKIRDFIKSFSESTTVHDLLSYRWPHIRQQELEKVPGWLDFVKVLPKREKTLLTSTLEYAHDIYGEDINIKQLKALDWSEYGYHYNYRAHKLLRNIFEPLK